MANLLHPNLHVKYSNKTNEFAENINKYSVIDIANSVTIHTYDNNFIEVADKLEIKTKVMQLKERNKKTAECLRKISNLENEITRIKKVAKERNLMETINTFNRNAINANPKHTKKIWGFIKWIRKKGKRNTRKISTR